MHRKILRSNARHGLVLSSSSVLPRNIVLSIDSSAPADEDIPTNRISKRTHPIIRPHRFRLKKRLVALKRKQDSAKLSPHLHVQKENRKIYTL